MSLTPDRTSMLLTDLLCAICKHTLNRAVEAPCCQHLFCTECVFEWLCISSACPTCQLGLFGSLLKPMHLRLSRILSQITVSCDYAIFGQYLECRDMVPLYKLRNHVSNEWLFHPGIAPPCPIRPVLTPATRVTDVLTSSPSKIQGDVARHQSAHLVAAQEEGGRLEIATS